MVLAAGAGQGQNYLLTTKLIYTLFTSKREIMTILEVVEAEGITAGPLQPVAPVQPQQPGQQPPVGPQQPVGPVQPQQPGQQPLVGPQQSVGPVQPQQPDILAYILYT